MNRVFKKVVSILSVIALLFGVAVFPGNAADNDRIIWDKEQAYDEGYTPLTTKEFLSTVITINNAFETLAGVQLIPEEKFEVVVSGHLNDIFAGIKEESGGVLDCDELIHNLPSLADSSKKVKTLLQLDMSVVEPALQKMSDDYYADGNLLLSFAATLLRLYLKTMEKCELYTVPVEGETGKFEVYFSLYFGDGTSQSGPTGIIYDAVSQTVNSKEGNGILGVGFYLDTEDYTIISAVDSWQRNFGFTMAYDIFSYVTNIFDYTTVRVKFNYDNKEWMIQLWKGRYVIATGGEIGIYNREIGAPGTYYNCVTDEEMMVMSMELYHLDNLIFEIEPTLHWWLTGFQLHPKAYLPESLTMNATIDFPTREMADLFAQAAADTGKIQLEQNGTHIAFVW